MNERGDFRVGPIVGVVFIFLALVGLFAICTDEDDGDVDSLGRIVLVSHEYDERGDGSDGNTGYDGEGGRSGAYDGGPGDDCRTACNNTIIVPSPGGQDDEERRR